MKAGVGVLDVACGVDAEAFSFEQSPLSALKLRRHVWTEPRICCDDPMPWDSGGLLFREAAEHGGDVAGDDIHVNGDAAIRGEFSRWNEADKADDLGTDAGKSDGGLTSHGKAMLPRLFECASEILLWVEKVIVILRSGGMMMA